MRVVFFGSPITAVPTLKALCDRGFEVLYVVTQPPRGRKRGKGEIPTPVATVAGELGLPMLAPERVGEISSVLDEARPEVGVIVAYGQIIPGRIISIFPHGILNLHFSLLPRWRGAAPVQRAILAGDTKTGVCTMLIDEGLDTGPVIDCESTEIRPGERAGELEARLAELGAPLMIRSLEALMAGTAHPRAQSSKEATYAPPLRREECYIDWTKSAIALERLVRAAYPNPGAYTSLGGKLLKIHKAKKIDELEVKKNGEGELEGVVVSYTASSAIVKCGQGLLEIEEVQPEGKRAMTAGAFFRGVRMSPPIRLGTP